MGEMGSLYVYWLCSLCQINEYIYKRKYKRVVTSFVIDWYYWRVMITPYMTLYITLCIPLYISPL